MNTYKIKDLKNTSATEKCASISQNTQILGNQSLLKNLRATSDNSIMQCIYKANTGELETGRKNASESDILYKGATSVDSTRGTEFSTYHHIIPMNKLIEYWNKLVSFDKNSVRTMMGSVITNIKNSVETADGASAFKRVEAGRPVSGQNSFADLEKNTGYIGKGLDENVADRGPDIKNAMEEIGACYQWLPGNLMLGPKETDRPNDGKNSFDYEVAYAREYFDTTAAEINYKALYDNITNFIALANYDAEKARLINETIVKLSQLSVYVPPQQFQIPVSEGEAPVTLRSWKESGDAKKSWVFADYVPEKKAGVR